MIKETRIINKIMAFLRSIVATKTTAVVAAAAGFAVASLPSCSYSSSHFTSSFSFKSLDFGSISLNSKHFLGPNKLLSQNFATFSAANMDSPVSSVHKPSIQDGSVFPELMTEYMVEMSCEGCVKAVRNKLETLDGIKSVEVDLSNQVVRILGSSPLKTMTEALELSGRKARLIGQGIPDDFLVSAAVAEFKGPEIFGVVRFAQVSMELMRIEANFSGLSRGKHAWTINEFGNLTEGAASTGNVYNPINEHAKEPLGMLGTLQVNEKGDAYFSGVKHHIRVVDLIGRAVVVYETEDLSSAGVAAAVIARSAGVGENYKSLCTCDGTTIWESSPSDFVTSKF